MTSPELSRSTLSTEVSCCLTNFGREALSIGCIASIIALYCCIYLPNYSPSTSQSSILPWSSACSIPLEVFW